MDLNRTPIQSQTGSNGTPVGSNSLSIITPYDYNRIQSDPILFQRCLKNMARIAPICFQMRAYSGLDVFCVAFQVSEPRMKIGQSIFPILLTYSFRNLFCLPGSFGDKSNVYPISYKFNCCPATPSFNNNS